MELQIKHKGHTYYRPFCLEVLLLAGAGRRARVHVLCLRSPVAAALQVPKGPRTQILSIFPKSFVFLVSKPYTPHIWTVRGQFEGPGSHIQGRPPG